MIDEISDVVVLNVDVFALGGGHGVGGKGDLALVVLEGGGWAREGKTNSRKRLT